MKSNSEIHERIDAVYKMLDVAKAKHKKLDQIEMLSGQGSKLRESIHRYESEIKALLWVIEN